MGGWPAARWWLLLRALAFLVFAGFETRALYDVHYFARSLAHVHRGLGHTLVEYPLPALVVIALPWVLAKLSGLAHVYVVLFAAGALATDAGFTAVLVRMRAHRTAVAAWLVGVPLLGAASYFRFDLVPAVLLGLAVLLLAVRPRLAMICVSVATAVKLWPALAIPALLGGARRRWSALGTVVVTGGVIALACVAAAGWSRLVSPLTYESHRGLQIESVWASPAMVGWAAGPHRWHIAFSPYKAFEIRGTGVHLLLLASSASELVLFAALVTLWWRMLRRGEPATAALVVWTVLAAVTGFVVVGKVLSPQYLLWLLAIAAAGLATTDGKDTRLRNWTVALLCATGMTHLLFPELYTGLERHVGLTPVAVSVLVVRNLLLLGLLGSAVWNAWRLGDRRQGRRPGPTSLRAET